MKRRISWVTADKKVLYAPSEKTEMKRQLIYLFLVSFSFSLLLMGGRGQGMTGRVEQSPPLSLWSFVADNAPLRSAQIVTVVEDCDTTHSGGREYSGLFTSWDATIRLCPSNIQTEAFKRLVWRHEKAHAFYYFNPKEGDYTDEYLADKTAVNQSLELGDCEAIQAYASADKERAKKPYQPGIEYARQIVAQYCQ